MRRLLLLLGLAWAGAAWAQPLEPPPEAPAGTDYTIEPADSVADGEVEVGMGAAGHAGSAPTRCINVQYAMIFFGTIVHSFSGRRIIRSTSLTSIFALSNFT